MLGSISTVSLFPLQAMRNMQAIGDNFGGSADPRTAIIIAIVFVALIGVGIAIRFISGGASGSAKPGKSGAPSPRMFNAFAMHRIASSYGLDKEQTKVLEFVFRTNSVTDPVK